MGHSTLWVLRGLRQNFYQTKYEKARYWKAAQRRQKLINEYEAAKRNPKAGVCNCRCHLVCGKPSKS